MTENPSWRIVLSNPALYLVTYAPQEEIERILTTHEEKGPLFWHTTLDSGETAYISTARISAVLEIGEETEEEEFHTSPEPQNDPGNGEA